MTNEPNQDDFFKIDPEAHLIGDSEPFEYFPGVKLWWHSIAAIKRPMMQGMPKSFMETGMNLLGRGIVNPAIGSLSSSFRS